MKKAVILLFTIVLNIGLFSCTPESVTNEIQEQQTCCGDNGSIPPPPPPPPPGDGD